MPSFDRKDVLAVVVLVAFIGIVFTFLLHPSDIKSEQLAVVNVLLGSIGTAFGTVVGYYFGSSASSQGKDAALAAAASAPVIVNGVETQQSPTPLVARPETIIPKLDSSNSWSDGINVTRPVGDNQDPT